MRRPARQPRPGEGAFPQPALPRAASSDGAGTFGPPVPAWLRRLTGETLVELLERAAARYPDAPFMLASRGSRLERWTYLDLLERSRRVASTLQDHGVRRGERVLTWCANDPWLVAAYFAIWRLGGVVVPLDLRMLPDVAVRIGVRTRPVLAIVGAEVAPGSAAALGVPMLRPEPADLDPDPLAGAPAAPLPGPSDLAEILFTSGSTGDPKGVTLTHAQVLASGRAITMTSGMRRERALALIPLSHMYGQIVPLLHGLTTGSQLTFPQSLTPTSLFAALQRDRITAITVVPQLLQLLMTGLENEAARRGELDRLRRARAIALHLPMPVRRRLFGAVHARLGGSLTVLTSGGARLPAELQLAWEAMGIEVIQGYGMTEYAAISGHSHRRRAPGTAGRPLCGVEVRVAGDGELLVRGPATMAGYWERPEDTDETLASGWLHTGDAGEIDRNGELVILSRTRDRIALPNGLKVYPEDVEAALLGTGSIRTAVALEQPAGRIAAVIIPHDRDAPAADLDAAVARANAGLAPHQRVRAWWPWPDDDFPRTHTLKVRRDRVAAWARERHVDAGARDAEAAVAPPAPEPSAAPVDPDRIPGRRRAPAMVVDAGGVGATPATAAALMPLLLDIVVDELTRASIAVPPDLAQATRLEELGLDSLGRAELTLAIEQRLGAFVDDRELADIGDLGELASLAARRRGSPPPAQPSLWAYGTPAVAARSALDWALVDPFLRLLTDLRVAGTEHALTLHRAALICANHTSHLDAPALRAALPRSVRRRTAIAAAADYFFEELALGGVVALAFGAFPFGRSERVGASLERVATHLDAGRNVIIFPEGTRSMTGCLGEFKPGVGLLATELHAPVLPAAIRGTWEILPKGRRVPRRGGHVVVRFGPPIEFGAGTGPAAAAQEVRRAVERLLGPDVRPARTA